MLTTFIFCVALFASDPSNTPYHEQCIQVHDNPRRFMNRVLQSIKPWKNYELISRSSGTETETGLTTYTLEIVP